MASRTFLTRLTRMSWSNRLLLVEALATLTAASLAIRLLPFRRVVAAAAVFGRAGPDDAARRQYHVRRLRWAVEACADRVPWRAVCFQRGLALHVMLRRRAIPSVLHYGVSQTSDKGLRAHVWITESGNDVLGCEMAGEFTCLASFPAQEPSLPLPARD
jgi:hypothetical protein